MKLTDLKATDLPLNGVPSLNADGNPMYLDIKHYDSYLFQMSAKYGEIEIIHVDGDYVVVSNEKYLIKQSKHHAYIQTKEYNDEVKKGEAMDRFLNQCKHTANA